MEYETEEQQVEALKAWWAENGRSVITGVVLGVAGIGGWTFWQNHQEAQMVAASESFSRTIEAVNSNDNAEAASLADALSEEHPDTLYSSYANLAAARADVAAEDLQSAAKRLKWVVEHSPQEAVKLIASVRLARVQGAMGDATAGLASLPGSFPSAFAGLVEEARGDLLLMSGDAESAKTAYEAAQASQYVANREGLTMKLNELVTPGAAAESAS